MEENNLSIIDALRRADTLSQYMTTTPLILRTLRTISTWIIESVPKLPDEVIVEHPDFLDGWHIAGEYEAGDRVSVGAGAYRCLIAHTATNETCPIDDDTHWERIVMKQKEDE